MKKIHRLPFFLLLLVLAGCQQPTGSTSAGSGSSSAQAILTIRTDASALGIQNSAGTGTSNRSLCPSSVDFSNITYTLTITGPTSLTQTNSSGVFVIATLPSGSYTYTVTAVSGTTLVGTTGSLSFTIQSGTSAALTPVLAVPAGTGTFSMTLSWPSSCSFNPTVTWKAAGGASANLTTTPAAGLAGGFTGITYTGANPAGCYVLNISLTLNGGTQASWGLLEGVYVYNGQTTSYVKQLTAADLNKPAAVTNLAVKWVEKATGSTPAAADFVPQLSWSPVTGASGYIIQCTSGGIASQSVTFVPASGKVCSTVPCYDGSSEVSAFPAGVVYSASAPSVLTHTDTSHNSSAASLQYQVYAVNSFGDSDPATITKPVMPAIWYVASGGTGDGSSSGSPTGDLQLAIDAASLAGSSGGTVNIGDTGTYVPASWPNMSSSHTAVNRHFSLRSYVTINGNGAILSGSVSGTPTLDTIFKNPTVVSANMNNVTITGALYTAFTGGGASSIGLTSCTFTGNRDNNGAGGAINFVGSGVASTTLTLTSCAFSSNYASSFGGAISIGGTTMNMTNCSFSGNTAANYAGAINFDGCNGTWTSVTFTGNKANGGNGGAATVSTSLPGTLKINGTSKFLSNQCTGSGGALLLNNPSTIITGTTFDTNTAGASGGAIYAESGSATVYIDSSKFTTNTATTDAGGAIYANVSSLKVVGSLPAQNYASNFADSFVGTSADFYNNSAPNATTGKCGGAIFTQMGTNTLIDVSFYGNSASYGGAVNMRQSGTLDAAGCVFIQNKIIATGNHGGAVEIYDNPSASFSGCLFDGNTSVVNGGAVYVDSVSNSLVPQFKKCQFYRNSCGGKGGAVWAGAASSTNPGGFVNPIFIYSVMAHNYSTAPSASCGHVVYCDSHANLALVRCTVMDNGVSSGSSNTAASYAGLSFVNASNSQLFIFCLLDSMDTGSMDGNTNGVFLSALSSTSSLFRDIAKNDYSVPLTNAATLAVPNGSQLTSSGSTAFWDGNGKYTLSSNAWTIAFTSDPNWAVVESDDIAGNSAGTLYYGAYTPYQ